MLPKALLYVSPQNTGLLLTVQMIYNYMYYKRYFAVVNQRSEMLPFKTFSFADKRHEDAVTLQTDAVSF